MSTFPTNGDYVQALQNPQTCFSDGELRAGQVELTALGMPKAISGNFASVFSITGASGKRYAVKCFTSEVKGQHRRYRDIHDALDRLTNPWQVGFEFIEKGVLVEGHWHAILRMEWVRDSRTLIPWLGENLGTPHRIMDVASQFASCIEDLQRAGIAHGDLQHGNVLIDSQNKLRLIDYDGMFVPSIENLGSNEIGLGNYQHPGRSGKDFGANLDRFSAWVIYGSLLSLAAQPALWFSFRHEGDEKLLFGKQDFLAPFDGIERLKVLGSPHMEVAQILLESLSSKNSLADVPAFDRNRIPLPHMEVQNPIDIQSRSGSAWWQQSATSTADNTAGGNFEKAAPLGAGWVRTHEAPLPPIEITGISRAAKALGCVITALALFAAIALSAAINIVLGGLVGVAWAAFVTLGTLMLWRRSETVLGRSDARRRARVAARDVAKQQDQVAKARSARDALNGEERKALVKLDRQRSKLAQASAAEYDRQSKDLHKREAALKKELNALDALKAKDTQQQLQAIQAAHIQTYLAARRIEQGVIHGIGPALASSMRAHGLHSAADIAGVRGTEFCRTGSNYWFTIHGIGPSKAIAINLWRQRVLAAASSGAPQSLPTQQVKAINSKFGDQKRLKQTAIDAIAPQMRQIKSAIDSKYKILAQEIAAKENAVRLDYRHRQSLGDALIAKEITELRRLEDTLLDAQRNSERYEHVTFSKFVTA